MRRGCSPERGFKPHVRLYRHPCSRNVPPGPRSIFEQKSRGRVPQARVHLLRSKYVTPLRVAGRHCRQRRVHENHHALRWQSAASNGNEWCHRRQRHMFRAQNAHLCLERYMSSGSAGGGEAACACRQVPCQRVLRRAYEVYARTEASAAAQLPVRVRCSSSGSARRGRSGEGSE